MVDNELDTEHTPMHGVMRAVPLGLLLWLLIGLVIWLI